MREVYVMGVNRLKGTPWHEEKFHRGEGDKRRYKGRCRFFEYEYEHQKDYCRKYFGKCIGCPHCSYYEEISEEDFAKKQKNRIVRKNNNYSKDKDSESYWWD